jgi:trehalose 6-phosphate synthase/phosphatase
MVLHVLSHTSLHSVALWPLFHYLLWQDVATEAPAEDQFWNGYLKANEAYAQKLFEVYRPGDLVWIHDYHCLLVPKAFRQLAPEAFIGLFVHTPFPSSEVFRCLPSEGFQKKSSYQDLIEISPS